MLPLELFRRRNFSVANVETFLMYGGLALQGFFLVLFLQQVAGFSATEAGAANLVPTAMMFLLSRRFGRLADRYGPRWFMTVGPCFVAAGFLLMLRLDADASWFGDLLPALVVFSLGLAITVSPLTATVLADADEHDAGIASAINNAIARTAGLLATAAVGAILATSYADRLDAELAGRTLSPASQAEVAAARERALSPVDVAALPEQERATVTAAVEDAGVATFHLAALIGAGMLALARACWAGCCCATRAARRRRAAAPAASSWARPRRSRCSRARGRPLRRRSARAARLKRPRGPPTTRASGLHQPHFPMPRSRGPSWRRRSSSARC